VTPVEGEPLAAAVTAVLGAYRHGETGALDRLIPLVYADLLRVARRMRRGPSPLATAELVHEVYVKMIDQSRVDARDRHHFFAIAAHAMRQVLVDHARRRQAAKRGGDRVETALDDDVGADLEWAPMPVEEVLAVNQALGRLGEVDPRLVRLVECRYFAGYDETETAAALGVSERTVYRDWKRARGWLRVELGR
jgi:RNA polymerase sigma factor (TIGR02999 family)